MLVCLHVHTFPLVKSVCICKHWHGVIRCNNTFNLFYVCMLIYVLACHSAFTYTGMVKAVHSCLSVLMPILCVCVCVCVGVVSGSRLLQPAQVCDMLRGLILVLCFSMMHYVDYSMMYHLIRGQSVIKLYIIYNMLEVTHTSHIDVYKLMSVYTLITCLYARMQLLLLQRHYI